MNSPQRRQRPGCSFSRSILRRGGCGWDLRWKGCGEDRFGAVVTALLLWIGVTTSVVPSFGAVTDYSIDTWQVEQGLPDNTVSSIVQTPDGYLWFGTFNGLVRFDGVRFKIFDSRTPGLESERVLRLFVDRQGGLWVSMEQGQLARYANGRFKAFNREDGWPMEPCVGRGMAMDHSQAVLFLTTGGRVLRFDGQRFTAFPIEAVPDPVPELIADVAGTVWLKQRDRLLRLENEHWTEFREWQTEELGAVTQSRDGGLWIFKRGELWRVQEGRSAVQKLAYPLRAGPTYMEEDELGRIWVATWGRGLLVLERDGSYQALGTASGLPSDVIRMFCKDREGNLWIATNGGGLVRLKPRIFSSLRRSVRRINRDVQPNPLPDAIPLSLGEDPSGRLWVGCLDVGAFVLAPGLTAESGLKGDGESIPQVDERIDASGIWSILASQYESGSMWVGSYGSGLGRWARDEVKWWSVREGLPSAVVVALYEAKNGTLWIGTDGGGLSRFDGQTFTNYTTREGLLSNQVRALTEDHTGALWIGTIGGGLNCLKDGQLTAFTRENGLPHRSVRALLADADGSLWIGTGGGLCLLRGRRLITFDTITDLAESEIAVILDDALGYLWCGSNRGVVRIARVELEAFARGEKKRIEFTTYGKGDGLASAQVSAGQPAGLRTRDGRLWFATVKGLSVVDPRTLRPNHVQPSVVIEDALVDGKSEIQDPKSDRLIVPPGRRRVEIRYTGLSLTSPERVRFRRKVERFDQDWQDVGTERLASYSGLPPGSYRFQVIAANNDGLWNMEGASLAFVVQPTLWQTWWAKALLVLLFGGAIGFVYRRRVVHLEALRLAQEEFSRGLIESQEQERKRIAAELHDSLGQNLLIIKNRALLGLAPEPGDTRQHCEEISRTASHAIQEVREIAYNLRPYQLDQFGLTEAIQAIVEKVAASSPIAFKTEIDSIDGLCSPADESHLFRIVQETTNNILKHSGATQARISLRRHTQHMNLVVEDNGSGIAPDPMGRDGKRAHGLGLSGIAERVRILRGTLEVTSAPGLGTKISITVPVAS